MSAPPGSNARLARKLLLTAVAMFAFGYAMVPFYRVVCQVTGFNGTTGRIDEREASAVVADRSREVVVEFVASTHAGLEWDFRPAARRVTVHPGQITTVTFHARNRTGARMAAQAVPSVTPIEAATHFHKIQCFCFSNQALDAGEAAEFPVQFVVDAGLPAEVRTLTLGYTFFDLPDGAVVADADTGPGATASPTL